MIARIFRKQTAAWAWIVMAAVMMIMLAAPEAQAAYTVRQTWVRFSATAGETLATGDVVAIKDADGYAYEADANAATLRPAMGIIGKGGASGATVEIIIQGILDGWSTLSEGTYGYLSETPSLVTQSAPSYAQVIGVAVSTTAYYFNFSNYFDSSAVTALGVLSGASPVIMEGATANDYETTIAVADPTADRTVTLADADGTVMLSSLAGNASGVTNSVTGGTNQVIFEGATADDYESVITATDPTADRTITIPDRTGQVQLASAASVITPSATPTLTVGLSNVYTDTPTDNEDQTITFSGAGTAGDEITIIFITIGTADEVITFHATLVSSTGTLTCDTTAARYYVVRFISNGTHWYEVSRTAVQT